MVRWREGESEGRRGRWGGGNSRSNSTQIRYYHLVSWPSIIRAGGDADNEKLGEMRSDRTACHMGASRKQT
jgi:hypothetical protein